MDQYYYEEGYIDASYFVYIAEADVQLTPYIVDYIESNYFEERGAWYSLYAEGIVPTAFEGEAALSVTATVTAVIGYFIDTGSTQSSAFTQSTTAAKTVSAACDFGALFAPSITAEGFRNHTAVLDSAFTIAIDAVANKAATLALANIVNVSSQGIKTAVYNSNLTTTVTQSTTAQKTSTASSTQSSAFTQSVDALNLQFGQSSLSTAVRFSARGFKRYERPWQIKSNSGCSISATSKFGQGSLTGTVSSILTYYAADSINVDLLNIEFWHRQTNSQINKPLLDYVRESDNLSVIKVEKNAGGALLVTVRGFNQTATTNVALDTNGNWQHILISVNTGFDDLSVFVDGQRRAYANSSSGISVPTGKKALLVYPRTVFIDELRFYSGGLDTDQTTYTVPSQAFQNDASTLFLAHYNADFEDDIALVQSGQAALTSAFTQSAQAIKTISAASNFAGAVAQSTTATKVTENPVAMSVTAAQTTDNIRVRFFDSSQSFAFTESAIIGSIKQFDSTNNALFTPSITAEGRLAGISVINAVSTISIAAVKTTDVDSVQSISVTQTTTAEKITDVVSTQSSAFTQTADAERIRDFDSATSSAFTQSSQEIYNVGFGVLLTTAVTLSADVLKLRRISSDLSSAFTQSASVAKTTDTGSVQLLNILQSTDTDRIRSFESSQTAIVSITSDAVKTTDIAETLLVVTAQTAQAFKTTDVAVNHITLFGSSIDADITARPLVYLETQASLSALIGVIRQLELEPIYGARFADDSRYIEYTDSSELPKIIEQGHTISFWMRKTNSDDFGYIIVSKQQPHPAWNLNISYQEKVDLVWSNLALTAPNQNTELRWVNAIPTDQRWHHYMMVLDPWPSSSPFGTRFYIRLYRDGQYVSTQQTPGGSVGGGAGYWWNPVVFGTDKYLVWNTYQQGQMSLAQVWIGDLTHTYTDNQSNWSSSFYNNGYVDLGANGQVGTTLPFIYEEFRVPYGAKVTGSSSLTDFYGGYPINGIGTIFDFTVNPVINSFLPQTDLSVAVQQLTTAESTRVGSADLVAAVSSTVDADYRIGVVADLASVTLQTATAGRIPTYIVSTASQATLSATIGFFLQAEAQLSDQFDFVCAFEAVPPTRGEADLVSAFTLAADAQSFTDAIIINTAFGNLVCDITVIPPIRVEADLTVTATMSVTIGAIEQFAVLTASLGTMTVSPVKTARADSTQSVSITQTTTAIKFTGIILTLYAFDSVLVAGDVINLDPYLTLWIKPESRTYEITAETRIITILQETRVNIIEGYSQ